MNSHQKNAWGLRKSEGGGGGSGGQRAFHMLFLLPEASPTSSPVKPALASDSRGLSTSL